MDGTDQGRVNAPRWLTRDRVAVLAGVLGPPALCAVLVPFRHSFANTDAALVLVAGIVAVASLGNRLGGWLAAISAGIWFDFFLTKPYEHFSITSWTDVETTLLLFVVGVGVTEIAVWGRRQHARAGQQAAYLAGLHAASEAVAAGGSPTELADRVGQLLTDILGLQKCHFHFGTGRGNPRLQHDGTLTWGGTRWDVDNKGFPLNEEPSCLSRPAGGSEGGF